MNDNMLMNPLLVDSMKQNRLNPMGKLHAALTRPQPRGSNACKSDPSQKLILKFKMTVLEDYWELEARIETTNPGNGLPERL